MLKRGGGWGMAWLRLMLLLPVLAMVGCPSGESGFQQDPSEETPTEGSVSGCAPTISSLSVAKGSTATGAIFARLTFSYSLPGCGGGVEDASVRAKVTNLDAPDPEAEDAYDIYDMPTNSSLVNLDTSAETISADFDFSKVSTTTTFEFSLRLIDSKGFVSNTIKEDVVYSDITEKL